MICVNGVYSVDLLKVRIWEGTINWIVGKLGNGDRVRRLTSQKQGNTRWCAIGILTDMREHGWLTA